uniref:Uncharacterized protein n=1 Tax=Arundo donax TaxID=35708 RepID=A0A0A8Z5R3_ARUDO
MSSLVLYLNKSL